MSELGSPFFDEHERGELGDRVRDNHENYLGKYSVFREVLKVEREVNSRDWPEESLRELGEELSRHIAALDGKAHEEGLIGERVEIFGDYIMFPRYGLDLEKGTMIITDEPEAMAGIHETNSGKQHRGAFAGFHVRITQDGDHDSLTVRFCVQVTAGRYSFAGIDGQTFAHGVLHTTGVEFFKDQIAEKMKRVLNEFGLYGGDTLSNEVSKLVELLLAEDDFLYDIKTLELIGDLAEGILSHTRFARDDNYLGLVCSLLSSGLVTKYEKFNITTDRIITNLELEGLELSTQDEPTKYQLFSLDGAKIDHIGVIDAYKPLFLNEAHSQPVSPKLPCLVVYTAVEGGDDNIDTLFIPLNSLRELTPAS